MRRLDKHYGVDRQSIVSRRSWRIGFLTLVPRSDVDLHSTFEELSLHHIARHGFRVYDLIHAASASVLACDNPLDLRFQGFVSGGAGRPDDNSKMTAAADKINRIDDPFRDKVLRKRGESVEMKQKCFEEHADDIEGCAATWRDVLPNSPASELFETRDAVPKTILNHK